MVVVGGPTQGRGLSRAGTRRKVLSRAAIRHRPARIDPRISIGLREWLDGLGLCGDTAAAAFDTRLNGLALLTGQASRTLAAELRHHGLRLVSDPMSFLVGPDDMLLPEEDARATAWAAELLRSMESHDQHPRHQIDGEHGPTVLGSLRAGETRHIDDFGGSR